MGGGILRRMAERGAAGNMKCRSEDRESRIEDRGQTSEDGGWRMEDSSSSGGSFIAKLAPNPGRFSTAALVGGRKAAVGKIAARF